MALIYFSGSISGGRADAGQYRWIVDQLTAQGHQVLAGMVTDPTIGHEGESGDASAIFERDLEWLQKVADAKGVLIAEVSVPSHGVGYEIATARYRFRIPVICLYRPSEGRRCSAMITGDPEIRLIEYSEEGRHSMMLKLLYEVSQTERE